MSHALKEPAEASTDLVVIERETALSVLTDPKKFDEFYERVRASTASLVPDVSTTKGRDHIRSVAMDVVRSKTAIDKAGLGLTEEWRGQTAKVNAARKAIAEKLDALRDEVRQPLTEWETAEKEREATVKAALDRLRAAAVISIDDTSQTLAARLAEVEAIAITSEVFQEYEAPARATWNTTTTALVSGIERLKTEEAERAELDELRRQKAAREEADRVAEAKRQHDADAKAAEERRVQEAQQAQERRDKAEADAQGRSDQAARDAAAKAQADAEERARVEAVQKDQAHAAEVARLQKIADDAAAENAVRDRAEAAAKAEQDRLAANRAHRSNRLRATKELIMTIGKIDEAAAKRIVTACVAGDVPGMTFTF